MSSKKKIFIVICIVALVVAVGFIMNGIFAASIGDVGEIFTKTTKYGWYKVDLTDVEVVEDEDGHRYEYEIEDLKNLTVEDVLSTGVYKDDLDDQFYRFCIAHDDPMPYRNEGGNIYKISSNSDDGSLGGRFLAARNAGNKVATYTDNKKGTELVLGYTPSSNGYMYVSRELNYTNVKVEEKSTENEKMNWARAYILSVTKDQGEGNNYDTIYQRALWETLRGTESNWGAPALSNEAKVIYNKAKAFEKYKSDVKTRSEQFKDLNVEDIGDKPLLNISVEDEYTYKYNESGHYFIAGPISIDYGKLTYDYDGETLEVRKIAELKLMGKDELGNVKQIEKFYFSDENGNNEKIGKLENFPGSNEVFYVKVYQKDNMYTKFQTIDSFSAKFKVLDAKAVAYEVTGITVEYTQWLPESEHTATHTVFNDAQNQAHMETYECTGPCIEHHTKADDSYWNPRNGSCYAWFDYDCTDAYEHEEGCKVYSVTHRYKTGINGLVSKGIIATHAEQNLWAVSQAGLYWKEYELDINFTKSTDAYMDIGGKVWIDTEPETKTGERDSIYNTVKESNRKEIGKENVLVQLFFEDGKEVTIGTHTVNGKEVKVVPDPENRNTAKNNGDKYTTYTDKNGDYKFYYLPHGIQYYVEFSFDGSTYEIVDYLAGGSNPGNTNKYIENPNKNEYKNNSKVKVETDRAGFNNKFTQITYTNFGKSTGTYKEYKVTYGKSNASRIDLNYITRTETIADAKYVISTVITTKGTNFIGKGPDTVGIKDILDSDRYIKVNGIDEYTVHSTLGEAKKPHIIKAKSAVNYPFKDKNGNYKIFTSVNGNELEYLNHVNLGLVERQKADFAVSLVLKAGATTIKDKEKVIEYSSRDKNPNFDITNTQEEYIKQEISASDYYWAENFEAIYKDGEKYYAVAGDKLNVYVLYSIVLGDQSEDPNDYGVMHEIIDYYDDRLQLVPESEISRAKSLFRKCVGLDASKIPTDTKSASWTDAGESVIWSNAGSFNGYKAIKTTKMINTYGREKDFSLEVGKGSENPNRIVYLILKVATEDGTNFLYTDEAKGMRNIVEIGSYTTRNISKNGTDTVIGKIDKDSAPGNVKPGDENTYEDDTAKAAMFRLAINWAPREIKGNVWDDLNGNAIIDSGEKDIKNVKVDLIEYVYNEKNKTVTPVVRPGLKIDESARKVVIATDNEGNGRTSANGEYSFKVEGGNYAIRFTFGDRVMLMNNSSKKYNAQDYMASMPSNVSVNINGTRSYYYALSNLKEYNLPEQHSMAFATEGKLLDYLTNPDYTSRVINLIDAREINPRYTSSDYENEESRKVYVPTNLSNGREKTELRSEIISNTVDISYEKGALLNKLTDAYAISRTDAEKLEKYTKMEVLSDIVVIDATDLATTSPRVINLGLEERPTASRALSTEITRIVLKTNDGVTIVDTTDTSKLSGVQKLADLDTFINISPSEMEGATLEIEYNLVIANDSKTDDKLINYIYSDFPIINDKASTRQGEASTKLTDAESLSTVIDMLNYRSGIYKFNIDSLESPLPIKVTVFDYVSKNLEFRNADNRNVTWTKVYDEDTKTNSIDSKWLSSDVFKGIKKESQRVSKVLAISTDSLANDGIISNTYGLTAGQKSPKIPIKLGITLSEDTDDEELLDFSFANSAEIVQVYSAAGRRDYNTIPGDYVPYTTVDKSDSRTGKYETTQDDAILSGSTIITPPLGQGKIYYLLTIVSASIIITGVILIKKKVLDK